MRRRLLLLSKVRRSWVGLLVPFLSVEDVYQFVQFLFSVWQKQSQQPDQRKTFANKSGYIFRNQGQDLSSHHNFKGGLKRRWGQRLGLGKSHWGRLCYWVPTKIKYKCVNVWAHPWVKKEQHWEGIVMERHECPVCEESKCKRSIRKEHIRGYVWRHNCMETRLERPGKVKCTNGSVDI